MEIYFVEQITEADFGCEETKRKEPMALLKLRAEEDSSEKYVEVSEAVLADQGISEGKKVIFTGEGKLDNQSFSGKVIAGIVKYAEMYNKRIIGVFGIIDYDLNKLPACMKDVFETNINHNDFEYVKKHAEADLRNTIKRIIF